MVKSLHRKKEPHILLKLDISIAFAYVSWPFLLEVLQFGIWTAVARSSLPDPVNLLYSDFNEWRTRGFNSASSQPLAGRPPLSDVIYLCDGLSRPESNPCSHQASFYADDAVVFLHPSFSDLQVFKLVLDILGQASGIRTNLSKSSASPIHCSEEDLLLTSEILVCEIKEFPCTYLGIPFSIRRPTKEVILPLVPKVAGHLPGWKASLMNRAGCLVMVRVVLSATPIDLLLALDLPKWVLKAIDKKHQ
ncbi:hypothetical protein U9M48_040008 [Paspalum notatum var. saurae]|uniref:Reverse transcriptase domain-containing protein n=1 Tax=Paspalum notatum var. saurae TaxID=547442 RepID=A0AAQ3UK51_PASNO